MTIESVTYISDLDATYPAEGEVGTLHEGNNHIRNIKTGIKNTFPKLAAAMSASAAELNCLVGLTATAAELNILAGAVVTTAELNYLSGLTATAGELNLLDGRASLGPISMTAQASTSGTEIDFTGIPAWAKRVMVTLAGVSTNGTSHPVVQIGDGSVVASGYVSYDNAAGTAATTSYASTVGFGLGGSQATNFVTATMVIAKITGNTWVASHSGGLLSGTNNYGLSGGGWIALSGALDRVRVTTTNGTDAFDAGAINVMYE
jgi:hypothetical protein